jgi:hypothetical protein
MHDSTHGKPFLKRDEEKKQKKNSFSKNQNENHSFDQSFNQSSNHFDDHSVEITLSTYNFIIAHLLYLHWPHLLTCTRWCDLPIEMKKKKRFFLFCFCFFVCLFVFNYLTTTNSPFPSLAIVLAGESTVVWATRTAQMSNRRKELNLCPA